MIKTRGILLLLTICILLTACQYGPGLDQLQMQQYGNAGNNDEYKADYDILDKGPVPGGVLNLFTTIPDTLNPILTKNTYVSDFLGLVYEGLTGLDEKQQAVPKLSDRWTVSGDGLIWNFHLRENVKWHDGEAFTASDVEFTVQTLMNAGIDSVYKPLVQNISTCAAVDSSDFRLVLSKPNSFLPEMMNFPILPKHQFSKTDLLTSSVGFKPVGTGPYLFDSYSDKKQVRLQKNPDWWFLGQDPQKKNIQNIETINVNVFNSPDDAMGALQTGEVDVMSIDCGDFAKYKGRTDLTIKKYTSREFEMLAMNVNNPILTDKYARKAISLAIDRNALINDVLPGDAQASEYPIMPDSWISDLNNVTVDQTVLNMYMNESRPVSLTTDGAIDTAGSTGASISAGNTVVGGTDVLTDSAITAKTPEEALIQGGWKASKQGYYKVIGGLRRYLKLELLVNSNNSTRVKAAQTVCNQLTQAGIQVVCTQLQWNDFLSRVYSFKYDMAFIGCRVPQIPDISYLYSSGYLPVQLPLSADNARNISGYFSLPLDSYLNGLFREDEPEKKKVFLKAALEQISNDTPYIGLYFKRNAVIYGKNLRGQMKPDSWSRYADAIYWYKPQAQ